MGGVGLEPPRIHGLNIFNPYIMLKPMLRNWLLIIYDILIYWHRYIHSLDNGFWLLLQQWLFFIIYNYTK